MRAWMVRAGENSQWLEGFKKGLVSIGWADFGDMSGLKAIEDFKARYIAVYKGMAPTKVGLESYELFRFAVDIKEGDVAVTYDTSAREYWVGTITSSYLYKPNEPEGFRNQRKVKWDGQVSRDSLSVSSRNSLGSALTLFEVNEAVLAELQAALKSGASRETKVADKKDIHEQLQVLTEDIKQKAHELLKDRILALDDREMEELAATILRAMGYRARVMPVGPDRGMDVFASPDGLGLQEPRIKVEVKHRQSSMGSNEIRSFLGGLRQGDKGLYISTGGFSKDAKYEANRSNVPLTLIDLDLLAQLVEQNYDRFDGDGKAMIPMISILWPSD